MKLVTSLTSPYGRKVRVVLLEKKIPFQLQVENPWLPDSPVSSLNPLGKVPVLVLEDGVSVFDSRVIVEYLDHVSPVAHLIPAEPKSRMAVRGVEALADGVTDAAVAVFLERKRSPEQQSADWLMLRGRFGIRSGRSSAAWFKPYQSAVDKSTPPAASRQCPASAGRQVMVRTAMPPPECRCMP